MSTIECLCAWTCPAAAQSIGAQEAGRLHSESKSGATAAMAIKTQKNGNLGTVYRSLNRGR